MEDKEAISILKNDFTHCGNCNGDHCYMCVEEAQNKGIEALEKQNHTCKNCGERNSDGWCKVVNVSCDVLEYCGCWSEVE